jgi:hypothetical protein
MNGQGIPYTYAGYLNEEGLTYYIKTPYGTCEDSVLVWGKYNNGDLALSIASKSQYEVYWKVTVNLEEYDRHPAPGYIFVKSYGENYKLYHALSEAGIVEADAIADIFGRGNTYVYHAKLTERALRSLAEAKLS